jgi:hypothetical protein
MLHVPPAVPTRWRCAERALPVFPEIVRRQYIRGLERGKAAAPFLPA